MAGVGAGSALVSGVPGFEVIDSRLALLDRLGCFGGGGVGGS